MNRHRLQDAVVRGIMMGVVIGMIVSTAFYLGYWAGRIEMEPVVIAANTVADNSLSRGNHAVVDEWLMRELWSALNPQGEAQ